jgi:hypothetical protein
MTNQTPAEALRQQLIKCLSIVQTYNVDEKGEAAIELEADHIVQLVTAYTATVEREAQTKREVYPTYYLYECPNGIHEFELTEVCNHCLAALQAP